MPAHRNTACARNSGGGPGLQILRSSERPTHDLRHPRQAKISRFGELPFWPEFEDFAYVDELPVDGVHHYAHDNQVRLNLRVPLENSFALVASSWREKRAIDLGCKC